MDDGGMSKSDIEHFQYLEKERLREENKELRKRNEDLFKQYEEKRDTLETAQQMLKHVNSFLLDEKCQFILFYPQVCKYNKRLQDKVDSMERIDVLNKKLMDSIRTMYSEYLFYAYDENNPDTPAKLMKRWVYNFKEILSKIGIKGEL